MNDERTVTADGRYKRATYDPTTNLATQELVAYISQVDRLLEHEARARETLLHIDHLTKEFNDLCEEMRKIRMIVTDYRNRLLDARKREDDE